MTPVPAGRREFETQALSSLESLYRTAQLVVDNDSDAQDLVQNTFSRAYHSWHKCQTSPGCRLWLHMIMASILLDKYRPSPHLSAAIHSADDGHGTIAIFQSVNELPIDDSSQVQPWATSLDDVAEAIRFLPDELRLCAALSLYEEFTHQEISYIEGIHIETIRSRIREAGQRLLRTLCGATVSYTAERYTPRTGQEQISEPGLGTRNRI